MFSHVYQSSQNLQGADLKEAATLWNNRRSAWPKPVSSATPLPENLIVNMTGNISGQRCYLYLTMIWEILSFMIVV